MAEKNIVLIEPETEEEILAINELLSTMREEKQKRQKIKMAISLTISDAISEIGLPEVKNIVRELYRELRELKE